MTHTGAGGYFDADARLPDCTDFLIATVERVASLAASDRLQQTNYSE